MEEPGTPKSRGRVLLLKAPKESEEDRFVEVLEVSGFRAVLVPVLAFNFVHQRELTNALSQPDHFCGIIFTSPRAVQAVSRVLDTFSDETKQQVCQNLRCFVVGKATADAAQEALFRPEGAESGSAEGLSEFILNAVSRDEKRPLFYPSAKMRRENLLDRLHNSGYCVEEIVAYETVPSPSIQKDIGREFSKKPGPDSVVFFSPSGVQFTRQAVETGVLPIEALKVFAIGPTTKDAIIKSGYPLAGTATKPDPSSLLQLLLKGQENDEIKKNTGEKRL